MIVGKTLVKLRLTGEPRGLLVNLRADLPGLSPERIAIALQKKRPRWSDNDFDYGWMVAGDRKLLEHRLSSLVLKMSGEEILTVRHVISVLGDWLDGKTAVPRIDIPTERVWIQIESIGKATETLSGLSRMESLEALDAIHLGPVYLEGRPRVPAVRWLPPIDSIDTTHSSEELKIIQSQIGSDYFSELSEQLRQLRVLFARKIDSRKKELRRLAAEVLGDKADDWLKQRNSYFGARIDSVESRYEYRRVLDELKAMKSPKKSSSGKIRGWRA